MFEIINKNKIVVNKMGEESLIEYIGLNLILSMLDFLLIGFEDPFVCSIIMWITIKAAIAIGKMKCNEKNRINVGFSTDGPPHNHVTISLPKIGIAERVPVITVAPQNDICPHGSTYPRKAVAIIISRIITPEIQVFFWFFGDEK